MLDGWTEGFVKGEEMARYSVGCPHCGRAYVVWGEDEWPLGKCWDCGLDMGTIESAGGRRTDDDEDED